jgi:O-antigen/teichoic acid export membrane protein
MAIRKTGKQFMLSLLFSVFAVGLNYMISLIITPYITENIGVEAYGFVSLAKTFANYASILTVALNSFAARYVSIEYHKNNIKKANVYFKSVFIADVFLGICILLVSAIVIIRLDSFLDIPTDLLVDVKFLFLLDMINFLILSTATVFMTTTTTKNRLELGSIIKCIGYLFEGGFLIIAYKILPPSVSYIGMALIISSCVVLALNILLTNKMTPEIGLGKGQFSIFAVKEVVGAGLWNSINSIGNTLNTGLDLIVCNMLLSATKSGQLAIVKTLSTIFSGLFQLISQPFQPIQLKYYAENNTEDLIKSFKLGIKISGMLSNIAFAGFAVFGTVYYTLWTPSQDIVLLQNISIVTIIGFIIEGAIYPLYYIYTLTLKNRIPCIVTIISGVLNVGGMYVLIKYFNSDIYGVVITTTVLSWIVNFIFNPMYSAHCLGENIFVFYPIIVRHMVSCIVITTTFYLISKIWTPATWMGLIIVALCGVVVGAGLHVLITLTKEEKIMAKRILFKAI